MKKILIKEAVDLVPLLNAFPYQQEAFNEIKDLDYAAIFHEQGLGKTKIAIDLLLYWLDKKDIDTVLIVTKKQLIYNWKEEFDRHTNIKPKILTTNKNSNFFIMNSPAKVILANFETITSEQERIKLFLKARNVAIIIDESAKLKNPSSKLTQSFFELSELFKIKVIMTGTPVANRPYDIWAQIYFLDFGKSLGENFKEFKASADLSNDLFENSNKKEMFERNISSIFEKIKQFTVRETKSSGIIKLPTKIYIDEWVNFNPKQRELYNQIKNECKLELMNEDKIIIDNSETSLKRLTRLIEVTSNPFIIDDSILVHSEKEKKLKMLIENIIDNDEKCIVWTSYIKNVDYFAEKYKNYGTAKIHGKMPIDRRNDAVKNFKSGEAKILFATPQAAKEGLTLTVANHVIFYDRTFSLDDYLQAQDRIHRISQTRTCYVHNIMIKNSIDEWINLLLEAKSVAAALSEGDITSEEYKKKINYNYGEIVKEILKEE